MKFLVSSVDRNGVDFFLFTAETAESAEKKQIVVAAFDRKRQKWLIIIVVNDSFYTCCKNPNIEIDQEPQLKICYFQIIQ